jgi:transcriptional regulator with XRE-family HTH domain
MRKEHIHKITETQGCWIKFMMDLNGITQHDIAIQAGCSSQMVSQVLGGRKNSERVKAALICILGNEAFETIPLFLKEGSI